MGAKVALERITWFRCAVIFLLHNFVLFRKWTITIFFFLNFSRDSLKMSKKTLYPHKKIIADDVILENALLHAAMTCVWGNRCQINIILAKRNAAICTLLASSAIYWLINWIWKWNLSLSLCQHGFYWKRDDVQ